MAKLTKDQIIEALKEMTMLEIHELIKSIETTFDVSSEIQVAAVGPQIAQVDEKTEFNVEITNVGQTKVKVIKVVKTALKVGLLDAKKIVEGDTPIIVKEGTSKEDAEELKKQLTEAGATVELK